MVKESTHPASVNALDYIEAFQWMMAELEHLPSPRADFTPGPDCYQRCID